MSVRETYLDGVCRERWDNATRQYSAYDAAGVLVASTEENPNPRAYTAQENADADLVAIAETEIANAADTANKIVNVDMPAMAVIIADTNANINANAAARIKDLAKAVRRLDRKVQNLLDGSD
jgi:hypothetical protein